MLSLKDELYDAQLRRVLCADLFLVKNLQTPPPLLRFDMLDRQQVSPGLFSNGTVCLFRISKWIS